MHRFTRMDTDQKTQEPQSAIGNPSPSRLSSTPNPQHQTPDTQHRSSSPSTLDPRPLLQRSAACHRGTEHTEKNAKRRSSSTDSRGWTQIRRPKSPNQQSGIPLPLVSLPPPTPNTEHPTPRRLPLYPLKRIPPSDAPVAPELTMFGCDARNSPDATCRSRERRNIFSAGALLFLCGRPGPQFPSPPTPGPPRLPPASAIRHPRSGMSHLSSGICHLRSVHARAPPSRICFSSPCARCLRGEDPLCSSRLELAAWSLKLSRPPSTHLHRWPQTKRPRGPHRRSGIPLPLVSLPPRTPKTEHPAPFFCPRPSRPACASTCAVGTADRWPHADRRARQRRGDFLRRVRGAREARYVLPCAKGARGEKRRSQV